MSTSCPSVTWAETTIQNWLDVVELDAELTCIRLTRNDRTGHLPKLLRDLAVRLRVDSESPSPPSQAARDHGALRHQQGYTAAMVVEESRILQVSIFSTLQRNLSGVDFSRLLLDVVTIADEVDSQLKQAMFSYVTPMTSKSQTARLAGEKTPGSGIIGTTMRRRGLGTDEKGIRTARTAVPLANRGRSPYSHP